MNFGGPDMEIKESIPIILNHVHFVFMTMHYWLLCRDCRLTVSSCRFCMRIDLAIMVRGRNYFFTPD